MIHLLTIGINKHNSEKIRELSSAVSDAHSVYSLFKDNFQEVGADTLLTDNLANKSAIESAISKLVSESSEEDMVVIYYSGHGTDNLSLVPFDYNIDTDEGITMEWIVEEFSKIKCKLGIIFLDCCFSGGAGSKVLEAGFSARDPELVDHSKFLNRLAGKGKVIFTASSSSESAWEGEDHGFFTKFLLDGLTGAIKQDAKNVSISALADYLAKEVLLEAQTIGKRQTPTFKSNLEGEVYLPLMKKGTNYYSYFPEEDELKTNGDLTDLAKWGFPESLIDIYKQTISRLNELQIDSVNNYGVLAGKNIVVSSPTSSGKTLIAEIAAIKTFLRNKRSIFLLPMKALVNDKFQEFVNKYGNYGLRIVRSTGDFRDEDKKVFMSQYDICLMTYEKFNVLVSRNPYILSQTGLVVVDEVQMLMDENRGIQVEILLTLIRAHANKIYNPQIIALSGVVGDVNDLDTWLSARLLKKEKRPIDLEENIITFEGNRRYRTNEETSFTDEANFIQPVHEYGKEVTGQVVTKPLVKKLVEEGKRVIVFRNTIAETTATAKYLGNLLRLPAAQSALASISADDPSLTTRDLVEVLSKGVAFHNGNLSVEERLVIEDEFRKRTGGIQVIVATTTLAMGINTPADAVIISSLDRQLGKESKPYQVAEYKNMIGRAGRLGFSDRGQSFVIVPTKAILEQKWQNYVLNRPEDISSVFNNDDAPNVLIKIISVIEEVTKSELSEIFLNLYGNFLKVRQGQLLEDDVKRVFENCLQSLLDSKILEILDDERFSLTDLGKIASEEGIKISSLIRLSSRLQGIGSRTLTEEEVIFLALITDELREFYFPVHTTSTKERQEWEDFIRNRGYEHLYNIENDVDILKKFAAIILYIEGNLLEEIEKFIQQHSREWQQSGRIIAVADRVKTFVKSIARIHTLLFPEITYSDGLLNELVVRLELGIKKECLILAMNPQFNFRRRELLSLLNKGILDVDGLIQNRENLNGVLSENNLTILHEMNESEPQ